VIPELGLWSASTRYRAIQHVPALERRFAEVSVLLPRDGVPRPPGRVGQARYFTTHAIRYAERMFELTRECASYDALFVQRGLYPVGPALIARSLDSHDGPIVFDLDDAVFFPSPSLQTKSQPARWLYGPQQARAVLARATAVIVSTPTLADALPRSAVPVTILPTVPDPRRYLPRKQETDRPVIIGWAGTVGGLGYLDGLSGVFERLSREQVARLRVVSSQRWEGPAEFRRWTLEEEVDLISDFTIGIMPLPDHPYTRAKAGFKLLQYMAAGIPVVASPVGVNQELVSQAGAGFLATTPAEWEDALRTLASDSRLRRRLGNSGREFVAKYADIEGQAETISSLLRGENVA
jgi:glycosyltransferase involved in cell wall biosynthesis